MFQQSMKHVKTGGVSSDKILFLYSRICRNIHDATLAFGTIVLDVALTRFLFLLYLRHDHIFAGFA